MVNKDRQSDQTIPLRQIHFPDNPHLPTTPEHPPSMIDPMNFYNSHSNIPIPYGRKIARMDRLVLRMSLYELLSPTDVPPKVVINEAVELSKAFGGENSSKFINGVLGTILRKYEDKTLEIPKNLLFKKKEVKK